MIYHYDGSFEGFLTAVFHVFDRKDNDAVVKLPGGVENLFNECIQVPPDSRLSNRVWRGLSAKVNRQSLMNIYASFLSEHLNAEAALLGYIKYIFSVSSPADSNFANPFVLKVSQIAKMVFRERHRMEAFVRFRLTKDHIFYAAVSPDFNVLPLLITHFTRRYADQQWLIYDLKRKHGIYYNLEKTSNIEISFTDDGQNERDIFHPDEEMYEELWKNYFHSVNIPARNNRKLHIRHIPLRYWQYMTEKKDLRIIS